MSDEWHERVEQKIEFLVEQQAQFFASLDKHSEQIQHNRELIESNSEQIGRNSEQIGRNGQDLGRLANLMADFVQVVDQRFGRIDERLNILIGVVERYFSNGRQ